MRYRLGDGWTEWRQIWHTHTLGYRAIDRLPYFWIHLLIKKFYYIRATIQYYIFVMLGPTTEMSTFLESAWKVRSNEPLLKHIFHRTSVLLRKKGVLQRMHNLIFFHFCPNRTCRKRWKNTIKTVRLYILVSIIWRRWKHNWLRLCRFPSIVIGKWVETLATWLSTPMAMLRSASTSVCLFVVWFDEI